MPVITYSIPKDLIQEALLYATKSKSFTSNRHDFHEGGLQAKKRKMFEGKLGEKIFKLFLQNHNIAFVEDSTSYTEADNYDFVINSNKTVDVKTRTKSFHTRTLEMVEQFEKNPKDIYVSVRLFPQKKEGYIIGWFLKEDILRINRIENNGYLENYVLFDKELRPIEQLLDYIEKINQ